MSENAPTQGTGVRASARFVRVSPFKARRVIDLIRGLHVDEGPTLNRFRPRALGRAYRIRKRTSHITVVVDSREA